MLEVVEIVFKKNGRAYYFDTNGLKLEKEQRVIVETDQGTQIGIIKEANYMIKAEKLKSALKPVLRVATKKDLDTYEKNQRDAQKALEKCKKIVEKKKIPMNLIDANYTFDRDKLVIRFLADNRIDFRDLVKEIANIYKVRIELRQIGARDKAKEVSGYGACGQQLCCSRFLKDLEAVSINMAKNQGIALNPSKINGVCGRLLCCLKYEDECYKKCRKGMLKIGDKIKTKEGEGTIIGLDILAQKYKVNVPEKGIIMVDKK